MSFLRWDVLAIAFVLAIPLLVMGYRGEFTAEQVVTRLPWCLLAGWGAMTVLRWASQPLQPATRETAPDTRPAAPEDAEPTPAP